MFKIYGSPMCPDCRECKANFDVNNVPYEFIDINENLHNLKVFLMMRDSDPVFDHCREINDIGLPALVREDGTVFLDWETWMKENGMEVKSYEVPEPSHIACSLDRKGC